MESARRSSSATKDALRHKQAKGERTGSVPYGFDLDQAGPRNDRGLPVKLVENDAEQTVLRRIFAWKAVGLSARQIAGELNTLGVPTKLARGDWFPSSVTRILSRKP